MKKKRVIMPPVVAIMAITVISKLFGFLREATIASTFGATSATDSYYMAITITTFLTNIITQLFYSSFLPIYTQEQIMGNTENRNQFMSNILNFSSILCVFFFFGNIVCSSASIPYCHWI